MNVQEYSSPHSNLRGADPLNEVKWIGVKFIFRQIAIVLFLLSLSTAIAHAQAPLKQTVSPARDSTDLDSTEIYEASQVVVSASRWEERASTVSREIITVTPAQINRNNPSTTADVLAQTGLVHVQKSQLGGGSPMLRGYAANQVLLVVDGVRMNNAIYRAGNLQNSITIDPLALESAEVLFGPGSVQYGSDALGGAMVFRTRRPTFADDDSSLHYGGASMLRYNSAMNSLAGSVAIDLGNDRVASTTVLSYNYFDDLRGGANFMSAYPDFGKRPWYVERINGKDSIVANANVALQRPTGYTQFNILENLVWRFKKDLSIEYSGSFTTSSDIPRYDRLIETRDSLPRFAEWYYGPQLWTMHALTFRRSNAGFFADDITTTAAFQYYSEQRNDRPFANDRRRTQDETVLIGSINLDLRKRLAARGAMETDLYYGVEAYINDVTSEAQRTNIVTQEITAANTRYPNGVNTVMSTAMYAQLRHGFSSSLTGAAGIRYTWYDLSSTINDTTLSPLPSTFEDLSVRTSAVTGSFGLTWIAAPWITLHTNLASGFRAPNLDDIAKVFETGPGMLIIPNPDLDPEYNSTIEGGVQWRPWHDVTFDVNGYYTQAIDAIEVRPTTLNGQDTIDLNGTPTAIYANTNIGEAMITGATASLNARAVEDLWIAATASYTYGRDTKNDAPISHIPPAFGSVRLMWKQPSWSVGASFWWSAAQTFDQIPNDDEVKVGINYTKDGTPAWRRLDVSGSYRPVATMEIIVGVENIFDLNYHTFASGISSPGRCVVASLRWSF